MLLGAACYLAETRNFAGTVYVIFQPAEELHAVAAMGLDQQAVSKIAAQMRVLSGHHDQAARAAASL